MVAVVCVDKGTKSKTDIWHLYTHEKRNSGTKMFMLKTKAVLKLYKESYLSCLMKPVGHQEKYIGFGLVVLLCPTYDGRVSEFILKIDHI